MKEVFKLGDTQTHQFVVQQSDLAEFAASKVHPICSTFALAREIEWSSRLFVLEMIDEDEEGVGTSLKIDHQSPALAGERLELIAEIISLDHHEITCKIRVQVGDRLIARAETGQKILKRTKIASLLDGLGNG